MITHWTIYLILMLDNLKVLFICFLMLSTLTLVIISALTIADITDKGSKQLWRCLRSSIASFLFFASAVALIPNTKQMAMILVIPKIANSEFVQETLPQEAKELYAIAKEALKEIFKEKCAKEGTGK